MPISAPIRIAELPLITSVISFITVKNKTGLKRTQTICRRAFT